MSVLSQSGISVTPTEFAESTRTAEDAVAAKRAPVKQTIYERRDQEELMVLVELMHPLEFLAVISLCNL